jgi:hypothetical protein
LGRNCRRTWSTLTFIEVPIGKDLINLQLRNKKMLRNESCDPLKIDAAVDKASIIGVTRKPILRIFKDRRTQEPLES